MTDKAIVRSGRNPLSVTVLIVALLLGIVGLADPSQASPTLNEVLGSQSWIWHTGLIIGSAISLLGILVLKPLNDVLVERAGMLWMTGIFLSYGVGTCVVDDAFFTTYSGVVLGLGLAFAVRAWQISMDLHRLRRALQSIPHQGTAEVQ